jgi:DNA-binding CsgD family transcriptional regulator
LAKGGGGFTEGSPFAKGGGGFALRATEDETEDETEAQEALVADLGYLPVGARGRIAQLRARGLMVRERVYELHVNHGLTLVQVARRLGIDDKTVWHHWRKLQSQIIANAPRSPDDFAALRERISAMLWQTIQLTCPAPLAEASAVARRATEARETERKPLPVAAGGEVDERAAVPVAMPVPPPVPPAPMLAIRLKALEQLARLYDVGLEQPTAAAFSTLPYATPEEIAHDVRQRVLELHGRDE